MKDDLEGSGVMMFSLRSNLAGVVNFLRSKASFSQVRSMAKNIEKEDALRLVSSIDNFLFDCDGVLWDGKQPIPGSVETITKLKSLGKRVYYVTNNSSKSRADYLKRCQDWGFPAEEEDILCTAFAAAQYLKMNQFKGKVYIVGREDSLGKEMDDAGIPHTGTGPDHITTPDVMEYLKTELDPEVKGVVVGFDPYISFPKILKACSYLKNPDCLFIGTNEDPCLPTNGPIRMPGTGTMISTVKAGSEREPVIIGKPEVWMFDMLQKLHGLDASRSLMTGDRLESDIQFAKKCGMKSFLVLTGNDCLEDIEKRGITPDYYADCLGTLGKALP